MRQPKQITEKLYRLLKKSKRIIVLIKNQSFKIWIQSMQQHYKTWLQYFSGRKNIKKLMICIWKL